MAVHKSRRSRATLNGVSQNEDEMSTKLASILIVDDNDDLREAFADLFANCGFRVRTAADGFTALADMKSNLPDVLISDLNMPIMSGFELLSLVRARFPEVRVIA